MRRLFRRGPSKELQRAQAALAARDQRALEARAVSEQLAVIRRRNGFGHAIRTSMGGTRP